MSALPRNGLLFALIGPAGSGKTTIARKLLEEFDHLSLSISVTSRPPREGEVDGEHYHFVTREEFEKKQKAGEFFECEETHGNYYGTLKKTLDDAISSATDLLLDIDIRGAINFKKTYPRNTVITFLLPPDTDELVRRVKGRGSVTEQELQARLQTAKAEYALLFSDLEGSGLVDYIVINDSLDLSYNQVKSILVAGRAACPRLSANEVRKRYSI